MTEPTSKELQQEIQLLREQLTEATELMNQLLYQLITKQEGKNE